MQSRTNTKHESFTDSLLTEKTGFFSDSFFNQKFLTHNHNKRDLRASGLSLLPLALRPLLLLPSFLVIFIFQAANVSAKSVTLTIPSAPLTLKVEPSSSTVFKKSSPGTISVATDSLYGYSLSIQSKTSNDLLNGSNKITSIVSALSESDYENNGDSNTWAYLPSKLGGSINTDFQPGPTTEPTTLDRIESSSEGTDYGLTLAAKIDNTLPAGNYSNTFVLSATSNDPPYDDIIQNWADCDTLESEESINLLDIRDNKIYSVAKLKDGQCWMTENLTIGSDDSATELSSEDTDLPSGSYTLPKGSTSGFNDNAKAFAHISDTDAWYSYPAATAGQNPSSGDATQSICPKGWRLPTYQEFNTLISQQNQANMTKFPANFTLGGDYLYSILENTSYGYYWSSTAQDSNYAWRMYLNSSTASTSSTNNRKSYGFSVRCVVRPDNLKKVGSLQTVDEWGDNIKEGKTVISKDIRDEKDYTVARLADGRLWMTQNLEIENKTLTPADSDVASEFELPASTNSPNSNNSFESKELHIDTSNNNFGGYYTWYTATAGEGTQAKLAGNVSHSICPKGWRLPTSADYTVLVNSVNNAIDTLRSSPNNFKLGGGYSNGSNTNYGTSAADYWSSTAFDENNTMVFVISIYNSRRNIYPETSGSKSTLYSVRCVSRTDDPGSMQTVDEWGDSIEYGKTAISKDIRDGKQYTVARLADGKLWMTQNLEIENKTLTPADSDVASEFELPASTDSPNKSNNYDSKEIHIDISYGGYYTWYTATAGEGTQDISSDDTNIEHSICPKGWRMPTGDDYVTLDIALGGTGSNQRDAWELVSKYTNSPNYFIKGRYYVNGYLNPYGITADYWSSTVSDANHAYYFHSDSSQVIPKNSGEKFVSSTYI